MLRKCWSVFFQLLILDTCFEEDQPNGQTGNEKAFWGTKIWCPFEGQRGQIQGPQDGDKGVAGLIVVFAEIGDCQVNVSGVHFIAAIQIREGVEAGR